MYCTFSLANVLRATAVCNFSTSELQKVLRDRQFFLTFSLPNVLLATATCIFSTSELQKVLPDPQFLTFWLHNVLFATAACNFSTSEPQKALRSWHALYIFTSTCAFRHSGVQFLISPLSTYLRTRRFNRPTFRLTRHTNHGKNTAFRDFSNIWRGCIFFLLTFTLVHLLSADLTACLICFSTLHIVGSLLFKLPSIISYYSCDMPTAIGQNSRLPVFLLREPIVWLRPKRPAVMTWLKVTCRILWLVTLHVSIHANAIIFNSKSCSLLK